MKDRNSIETIVKEKYVVIFDQWPSNVIKRKKEKVWENVDRH